jgi:TM2 domain-containing membrane protein YozV
MGVLTVPGQMLPGIGWHLAGLHKFYLGQPRWGLLYLILAWTPIPVVASVIEGVWYLAQGQDLFDANFNNSPLPVASPRSSRPLGSPRPNGAIAQPVADIAAAMRQLDQLREDGLITEYEFEQKRRQLLDRIG